MAIRVRGGDPRDEDEDEENYRSRILLNRELCSRTIFRAVFGPSPNPKTLTIASNDGSITAYPIASYISLSTQHVYAHKKMDQQYSHNIFLAEPLCLIQGHKGPAYDLKFYGDGDETLLSSCGDDGHIRGWRWMNSLSSEALMNAQGNYLNPILDLLNLQYEGPWGALSLILEINVITVNKIEGSIYTTVGDSRAYWG